MFSLTPSMNYYLCPGAVDMRKGIYSLYHLVKSEMQRNPLSGEVFLFLGKKRDTLKILHWQEDGFVLYIKKLERGTFETPCFNPDTRLYELPWKAFVLIAEGVSIKSARYRNRLKIGLNG